MSRIAESELIINDRGAIYHLDLRPEEIADTVILVGDPHRVEKVSKYFDRIEHRCSHREFNTHTGYIGSKRISVLSTGIGPDNIDIAINELDALVNIDFEKREIRENRRILHLIRFGTSGAIQADIPVDSFIASTHGLGLDNVLNYYVFDKNLAETAMVEAFIAATGFDTRITIPYIFKGSQLLASHFKEGYFHGITITSPGFYGPQGRVLRLNNHQEDRIDRFAEFSYEGHRITNFEMETSAIFGLGKLLGHQCLSLNAVLANRVLRTLTKDSNALVENLIKKSIEIVASITSAD